MILKNVNGEDIIYLLSEFIDFVSKKENVSSDVFLDTIIEKAIRLKTRIRKKRKELMREVNFIEDNGRFSITFKSDNKAEANTIMNAIQRFISKNSNNEIKIYYNIF
ncbi:hypothetical protein [Brachyspira hyodysenteriae]|uniref:hypothetical protein n=1 Tax=Brachyspira hyodysenteriae TaxID=159 RepID=UPI0022CDE268|nr:hypothetical protein [Brachyspira hyodysenteriae]MDA0087607.1 hypothetical protein [Brachyspira hyodysenteriae]